MAKEPGVSPSTTSSVKQRKAFISPESSFIDFGNIENEYYTEGRMVAQDYNPYKERKLKKPITGFEVATHLLRGSVAAGVLAMPKGFTNIGIVAGIFVTLLLTSLTIYAMDVLLTMQYIQCQRLRVPFIPLPASMRIGFKNGPKCLHWLHVIAPFLVDFFLISCQLGCCAAYVIFIASSIKQVVEPGLVEEMDLKGYILMIFIPVVLTNYIRDLKKLMPLSLFANILVLLTLFCCFYYIFFVGPWKTDTSKLVVPVKTWPLFFGTVLFALDAVGLITALEHNMERPEHFLGWRGIFPWCTFFIAFMLLLVGLIGYLKYGEDVKETIFASLPEDEWLALTIYAIYGFCVYLTYPLQCFVSLEILWGNYIRHTVKDPLKEFIFEYILRTVTVLVTFLAALLIPQFDVVVSLIGVFSAAGLGLILPFVLEMLTLWPDELGRCNWILIKDVLLIAFGFIVFVDGTYVSLYTYYYQ